MLYQNWLSKLILYKHWKLIHFKMKWWFPREDDIVYELSIGSVLCRCVFYWLLIPLYIAVFFLGYRKPSKVDTYSEPEVIRRKNAVTFVFLRVVRSDFQDFFVSVCSLYWPTIYWLKKHCYINGSRVPGILSRNSPLTSPNTSKDRKIVLKGTDVNRGGSRSR